MGSAGDFDFWLGEWQVSWNDGKAHGRNTITKEYGDRVVHERFDGRPGIDLRGMSVSVYREDVDLWLQTWVDDSGSYFDLRGGFADGEMVLQCEVPGPEGATSYRMRFFDIEPDRLTWTWERLDDGGASWRELWRLAYSRLSQSG